LSSDRWPDSNKAAVEKGTVPLTAIRSQVRYHAVVERRPQRKTLNGTVPLSFCQVNAMNRIHVLPVSLVSKIAAGEVIERPSSVLKELLENSVDAGATRVEIAVEDGGRRLVQVADDGCGMNRDDLALAVQPHATSKLTSEEDLFKIATMGFRGEALPSIGSVAQLRIVSRAADEPGGHEILASGGQVEGPRPVAAPVGTTVEVRELFFNVPARRKFLKTTNTEMGHLTEQLIRIGLAHPHVHLICAHNGRRTHDLPASGGQDVGEGLRARIASLFSQELAGALIRIDRRERGLRVYGWVAPPGQARGTPAWQYTWLNGRYIRDRFLQHAIREAYRGLLPEGRFPVVFLFLETNPADVDVNVHPTKIEVRFRDSNLVHSQVLAAMRETFLRRDLAPGVSAESLTQGEVSYSDSAEGPAPAQRGERQVGAPAKPAADLYSPGQQQIREAFADFLKNLPPTRVTRPFGAEDEPGSVANELSGDRRPLLSPADRRMADEPRPPALGPKGRAIQLHNTYLVTESDDGLIIIDQHALHERIIYQELVARIGRGPLESQRLLLPETIDVTPAEVACLESFGKLFEQLGLDLTPFGPTTVAVQAVPSVLSDVDVADWVSQLLVRLADKPDQAATDEFIQEVLESMACKAAVKAGDPLTAEEITALLERRREIEKPSACPHGRPTTLHLSISDLEKQFKRT
jgi:DNA mismatch repair protein MutL